MRAVGPPTGAIPRTERVARSGSCRRRVQWPCAARAQELAPCGEWLRVPLAGTGPGGPRRAQCIQQERDRGGSVGHGVVHLGHDGEAIVGQSLDHDDLPQRAVPGQRPARHVGHHGGERAVILRAAATRRRVTCCRRSKSGSSTHTGCPRPQGHRHRPSPERGEPVESTAEQLDDLVVGDTHRGPPTCRTPPPSRCACGSSGSPSRGTWRRARPSAPTVSPRFGA